MIKSIHIQNFKALRDTKETKIGKITLLTGINGRGKSSFLQSMLLLSQSLRRSQGDPKVLFSTGDWCTLGNFADLVTVGAKSPVTIEFQTDASVENKFSFQYVPSSEKLTMGEAVSCRIDDKETIAQGEEHGVDEVGVPQFGTPEGNAEPVVAQTRTTYSDVIDLMKLANLYFVSSSRIAASNEETIVDTFNPNYIGANGQYILNVLSQCTQEQIKEVEKWMSVIMDGATVKVEKDEVNGRVYLYLDAENNGANFRPVNVGYGYSYIISTILSVVLAKSGEIVIIENPEAHLHPQAQSRLMNYIIKMANEKNVQFFVETHSDHIVNASLLALKDGMPLKMLEILFFNRSNSLAEGTTVCNLQLLQNGRVVNPPRGFCDQYAIDLKKIMRPSYAQSTRTRTEN